jgi:hypothetical protein
VKTRERKGSNYSYSILTHSSISRSERTIRRLLSYSRSSPILFSARKASNFSLLARSLP